MAARIQGQGARAGPCGEALHEAHAAMAVDADDREAAVALRAEGQLAPGVEAGGIHAFTDLDGVPAGSTWKLVVRHDGNRIATRIGHAEPDDGRYEVDFPEVHSRNTPGADRFKVKIVRVDGPGKAVRTLVFGR